MRHALLICAALLVAQVAWGHGGVSIEDDRCVLKAGGYKAHFTGYQPKVRGTQEFCEDIPEVSAAIIVLDFVDRGLRDQRVDFRLLDDVKQIGVKATYADLGTPSDIEAATLNYVPPERYPGGSVMLDYEFTQPGQYIGVVSIVSDTDEVLATSVFPFSVGIPSYGQYAPLLIGLGLFIGTVFYLSARKTKKFREKTAQPG